MTKSVKNLSLCALLSALSVVFMLGGCFIQSLDLSFGIFAGLAVVVAMIECGTKYSVLLYLATSVLSLVLLPVKTPALFYVLIGGIYPILKSLAERIKNKKAVWALKIIGFNIFFTALLAAGKYLLQIADPIFSFNILVYGLGNLTFVLYDIAFTRLITFYIFKIRRKFK